jgi:superfamily II DNA or RNA helicase
MNLFRVPPRSLGVSETPALLFRDLKRDQAIKFLWLWGHQEKVLDAFHKAHVNAKDLAIELPTGTGKTLVGLLIGEFRRINRSERVVFLCATKQLCAQVNRHVRHYLAHKGGRLWRACTLR